MKHSMYNKIKSLIDEDIAVLLEGDAGSGKTTIAKQMAEDLGLGFYTNSLTKQTSVANLVGFIDIHGKYSPTQLRDAFENGGIYLLDELDAGDANTLLILNTIENGYISFPDKVVNKHKDFRLIATCNPLSENRQYTGRSRLDESTLDRFVRIILELDHNLEIELVGKDVKDYVDKIRHEMYSHGITKKVSMRSAIAFKKLHDMEFDNAEQYTVLKGVDEYQTIIDTVRADKPEKQVVINNWNDFMEAINGRARVDDSVEQGSN